MSKTTSSAPHAADSSCPPLKRYADIDWQSLRLQALAEKGWKDKKATDWDKKAASFAGRVKDSIYSEKFLVSLPLSSSLSVLDVGSGPGTLALPIAGNSSHVTAIDFSPAMLQIIDEKAKQQGLTNITTIPVAWEDDWDAAGVKAHDIAIASRSLGVKDLHAALTKLNQFATKYVFLTDRIGSTPFDLDAFHAIGRECKPGPDYIFTLNLLYTMNIHPNVTVLELEQETSYASMQEAYNSYSWMFHEMNADEERQLRAYLETITISSRSSNSEQVTLRRRQPPRWALIWWKK